MRIFFAYFHAVLYQLWHFRKRYLLVESRDNRKIIWIAIVDKDSDIPFEGWKIIKTFYAR